MFKIGKTDVKDVARFENMLASLGEKDARDAVNRAVARTGDMARTQVVRTLAVQTGLNQKIIRRSLHVSRPSKGFPVYVIHSAGGNVSLKFFKRRETKDGVEAYLGAERGNELFWGKTFFKGGVFPRRRVELTRMHGHVFARTGSRTDFQRVDSGIFIPAEMVDGASAVAFENAVERNLPRRLDHEISRAMGL